jgi:hypothetical protein
MIKFFILKNVQGSVKSFRRTAAESKKTYLIRMRLWAARYDTKSYQPYFYGIVFLNLMAINFYNADIIHRYLHICMPGLKPFVNGLF